ncbi:BGTF surface domain-containing protein [Halorubellus sp. PRR65]|uniref:BGTF surface domain-containing protein n=1 Tax=Halorubellus sp. PRR65 TaxID=3098148 RepID=UPI002B257D8E|nr:BGTF surface domain-containing protein [Halorubellus sp. PRR65]
MSRRPARETVAFAVALAAIAALGGVAAASVAAGAPANATVGHDDADAPPNATVDYDGERLVVEQTDDAAITGTTTLENGSQVTLRIKSVDSQNPFLRQAVASVDENGSFEAAVDFAEIERGTEFEVSVRYNGTELGSAPGVVGECAPSCGGGDAEFDQKVYTESAGGRVEVRVGLTDRETATVVFGSEPTNVRIPVTVTDGNDDGKVTLVIETRVDGLNDPGVYASADADSLTVHQDLDRPQSLAPGNYPMSLYLEDGGERFEVDISTVVLQEASDTQPTTRGGDAGTTAVGTIYGSATTSTPTGDGGGVSMTTVGALAVGGLLAILGVVALVGDFD